MLDLLDELPINIRSEHLQDIFREIQTNFDEVSSTPFLAIDASNKQFGATPSEKLVNAITQSNGATIFLPEGEHVIGVDFIIPANGAVHIKGVPGKTIIKYNNDESGLVFRGEYSNEFVVTALNKSTVGSANGADDIVTRLSVTGDLSTFEANDIGKIYSQDVSDYGTTPSDKNRIGQLFKILSVDKVNGYIFVDGQLEDHHKYLTEIKIRKIEKSTVTLTDIIFEINGTDSELWDTSLTSRQTALSLWGITHLKLDNVRVNSAWAQGINLIGCWNPQVNVYIDDLINGTDVTWTGLNALGYGVTVMGCMAGTLTINGTGCRHMFTTVHPKDLNYSAARWLEYGETIGTIISGTNIGSRGTPFDTHESGIGLTFLNCKSINPLRGPSGNIRSKGFSNRARHTRYVNCEVTGGNQGFDHSDIEHGEVNTVTYINPTVFKLYGPSGFAFTVQGAGDGNTIARILGMTSDQCWRILEVSGAKAFIQGGVIAIHGDYFCRVNLDGELTIQGVLVDFTNSLNNEYAIRLAGDSKVKVVSMHLAGDSKCTSVFHADDAIGTKEIKYTGITSDSATKDPGTVSGTTPPVATKIDPV